ncbi:hypothetical protein [Actinocorallia lasiicapitis]
MAEIRHLFNLATAINNGLDLGIYWSNYRRAHQAEARRRHFRRRLRLQVMKI